jgi:hypothetical protein
MLISWLPFTVPTPPLDSDAEPRAWAYTARVRGRRGGAESVHYGSFEARDGRHAM